MNRRDISQWGYEDQDQFDSYDQYNYQDQYESQDQYDSYSNDDYQSNSYRNSGNSGYQSPRAPSRAFNGNWRKSNAGRRNNQQSISRNGQQALNNEPIVGHIGYIEVESPSNPETALKSTISKMAPPGSNIVVNIVNINHEY